MVHLGEIELGIGKTGTVELVRIIMQQVSNGISFDSYLTAGVRVAHVTRVGHGESKESR